MNQSQNNLVAVADSGMLHSWIDHLDGRGWSDSDLGEVYQSVQKMFGTIDRDEFTQLVEDLESKRSRQPSRFSPSFSLEDIYAPQTQSSGALAHPIDFAEAYAFDSTRGDLFLGRCPVTGTPIGYHDDRHAIMFCQTRSGKGTGIIIPNHLLWPGPLVSLDPKGENATVSAARRGQGNDVCIGLGQKVCVLDPFHAADIEDRYRASFNPLDELSVDDPACQRKAAAIAEAMVVKSGREHEDYWKDEPISILHALILHVISSPQFEGRRNLITVRRLIRSGDSEAVAKLKANRAAEAAKTGGKGEPKKLPNPMSMLFSMMMGNPAFQGTIADKGRKLLELKTDAAKQWVGVDSSLEVQTRWIDDQQVQSCLERSDFKLSEFKENPDGLSVYLCLPERDAETFKRWQRLIINQIAYELRGSRQKPVIGHQVLMCLDEFATLERLETFEKGVSHFAGYGIRLLMVFQDVSQIKRVYQDSWATFLGNSSTKIFFDIDNTETQELVQKMAGQIELLRQTATHGVSSGSSRGIAAGRASGMNASMGQQSNQNQSLSHTRGSGYGESSNVQHSVGRGSSRGSGFSQNEHSGYAESASYDRPRIIGRNMLKSDWLGWLRQNEKMSLNKSGGSGTSRNTHQSENENESFGSSEGRTRNVNESTAIASSAGSGENSQVGVNRSSNQSVNMSSNEQISAGHQEVFQLRHLFQLDDLRRFFAKETDRSQPHYPGLSLIFIGPEDPAILRRVNYYED